MSKYRMYSLVLRQLNPMQKGVQSAHSIVEYATKFHNTVEYVQWSRVDKTLIVLDGGTLPELKECRDVLSDLKVPYAAFYEEDLGGMLTSISFIVDDKVWDYKSYPSFDDEMNDDESDNSETHLWIIEMGGLRNLNLRQFLGSKRLAQ